MPNVIEISGLLKAGLGKKGKGIPNVAALFGDEPVTKKMRTKNGIADKDNEKALLSAAKKGDLNTLMMGRLWGLW